MRLKDCCMLNPAFEGELLDASVSFVPMESLRNGNIDLKEIHFLEAKGKYTYFADGDLLIAKVTPCFENGNIAIADNLKNGIGFGSSEIFVLRMNKKVLNRYMFYLSQTSRFQDAACATMCGVGGLKRISPLFFKSYEIELPSIILQQRIVDYLDEKNKIIDHRIEVLEKQTNVYTRLKKSIIHQAVTRGLNPDVHMKDSGIEWIGKIPNHWEIKRFKEFAKAIKGKQCDYYDSQDDNMAVVLTVETLRQNVPTFYNYGIIDDKKQLCTSNDIVVIWDGAGVGEFLKAKNGLLSSTIARVDVDSKKVLKSYLWYWRYNIEYRLKCIPTGMGIPHLNPYLLNNYKMPIPPIEEQSVIVCFLDEKCAKIDAAIENISKQIDASKRLKKAIVNEAISGKINFDNN